MRPDQIQRLNDLSERLADKFLVEADPDEWPGANQAPSEITQQERGDAYWCKKNAMATGGVLRYTLDLVKSHSGEVKEDEDAVAQESDLDKKIKEAERRAAQAVERVLNKAKKRNFDQKLHGKA